MFAAYVYSSFLADRITKQIIIIFIFVLKFLSTFEKWKASIAMNPSNCSSNLARNISTRVCSHHFIDAELVCGVDGSWL